ncbi:MAG: sulfatase-like hydrolase/transferase [Myxococcales bacterium]|nr:sulfatase-like hydrolase/transferase [Myxococcales bacterium]
MRAALFALSLLCWACDDGPASGPHDDAGGTDQALSDRSLADTGLAADRGPSADAGAPTAAPNLVLVVLDDVGPEAVEPWASRFAADAIVAPTPTLDGLAAQGVAFETAWATPTCSPTRIGLHTGAYPSHAGVLGPAARASTLTPDQPTLPKLLAAVGYRTGLFGKWHLGGAAGAPVTEGGWHAYAGQPDGALADYFAWERTEAHEGGLDSAPTTLYATTAVVDDALAWLATQPAEQPWLVMLAFNAPHTPLHLPPAALRPLLPDAALDADGDGACDADGPCVRAMLHALDTELGRFLAGADGLAHGRPTVVVALGDNGTVASAQQPPFARPHAKGTLFEGGVRVPLWISGPPALVPARGVATGLAHAGVDVFATLLDLGGATAPADARGISLRPALADLAAEPRALLYTDGDHTVRMVTTEGAALRDGIHKVLWPDVSQPDAWQCFDLAADPDERSDLRAGEPPTACAELMEALRSAR